MPIDEATREQIQHLCAAEKFGVLATVEDRQPYTASIRFATTPELDLIVIARAATQKVQLASRQPNVAFQVDNREVTATDQAAFARATFLGELELVPPQGSDFGGLKQTYLAKLPEAEPFFKAPDINLYRLRTRRIRFNCGLGQPARELTP